MSDDGQFVVVLDAGHGGKDPGAIGSSSSNREKDINLGIALEVGRLLKANCPDVKLIYTRSTDVFIELGRRAEIANKAKADLFVSIHTNALPKNARKASGVQSYTLTLRTASTNLEVEKRENSVIALEGEAAKKYNYNPSPESNIMFELMQDHDMKESVNFAKMVQSEMVHTAGRNDMGVLQANLAVLRLTYMPSVLLEVGYISTPSEEQFLMSTAGRQTMAKSIYNAIAKYKTQKTGKESRLEKPSATPVQQTTTTTTNDTPTTSSPATTNGEKHTVYKIQVLAGSVKLKSNDKQFKGLKCEMHEKGGRYTYTYGSAKTMDEAKKLRQSILDKFPQAFIVTFEE
jgi:N-acetylmuramoyl-L-alanine amidase